MNPGYPSSQRRGAASFVFKGAGFLPCLLVFDLWRKEVGAGDRSRTYTGVSPEDFESSASAIPPLRHVSILGQLSPIGNRSPRQPSSRNYILRRSNSRSPMTKKGRFRNPNKCGRLVHY